MGKDFLLLTFFNGVRDEGMRQRAQIGFLKIKIWGKTLAQKQPTMPSQF